MHGLHICSYSYYFTFGFIPIEVFPSKYNIDIVCSFLHIVVHALIPLFQTFYGSYLESLNLPLVYFLSHIFVSLFSNTNFLCEGFMVSFLLCVMATGKFVIMDHGFSIYLVKVQLATTLVSCVGRGFGY